MKRVGERDGEGIEVFIPLSGLVVLLGNTTITEVVPFSGLVVLLGIVSLIWGTAATLNSVPSF